jgi:hypothetical protein
MKKHTLAHFFVALVAAVLFCHARLVAQTDSCKDLAKKVIEDPTLVKTNVLDVSNSPSCFFQASLSNPDANQAIAPARTSFFNAIQSFSGGQQQGSSLSSSGSTNAVSKPSGPTSLAQEFGGADVSRGTSSTTVTWSPGTMLTNLALGGVYHLCLTKDNPKPCISAGTLRNLAPLTFKITANTSSGSSSVAGTAANSTSNGSSQQVNLKSQGSSGPNFSGLTVQYSLFGSRSRDGVKSLTGQSLAKQSKSSQGKGEGTSSAPAPTLKYYENELAAAWKTGNALDACDPYLKWKAKKEPELSQKVRGADNTQMEAVQKGIEGAYQTLLKEMLESKSCKPALDSFQFLYAAILEAKTYEDFKDMQPNSATPELALEYDLNTPQSKPSYSTVKLTGNWQFGKSNPSRESSGKANQKEKDKQALKQQEIRNYAKKQGAALAEAGPGNAQHTSKDLAANAKDLAQDNTKPLSFTATATVDIYNAQPSSSIPSASHLRDISAGAELAYVFSPFGKNSLIGKALGSATLAGAYSYQDQTSPAILTGPALSDFTGLPSSVTSVYAKRGVIHLGQVRLGLGTGKNMTFPLAFTYSNRTELITHPTWGLQFGITYNLNSLFSSGTGDSGN